MVLTFCIKYDAWKSRSVCLSDAEGGQVEEEEEGRRGGGEAAADRHADDSPGAEDEEEIGHVARRQPAVSRHLNLHAPILSDQREGRGKEGGEERERERVGEGERECCAGDSSTCTSHPIPSPQVKGRERVEEWRIAKRDRGRVSECVSPAGERVSACERAEAKSVPER